MALEQFFGLLVLALYAWAIVSNVTEHPVPRPKTRDPFSRADR